MKGKEWFDFSNFPEDHPNYDITNMMVPGKFKVESPKDTFMELAGHRAKMYAMLTQNGDEKRLLMVYVRE